MSVSWYRQLCHSFFVKGCQLLQLSRLGTGLRPASYTANSLNQYTSRTVPGAVDILGIANSAATVTVNSLATYRKGEYFWKELNVANGSGPQYANVTVIAANGGSSTTNSGSLFVAQASESYSHDVDGNLTSDGRWSYTWDAENRVIQAESLASGPLASKRKVVWEYDSQGRRIRQTTSEGSSGSYVVTEDLKFVSDGWRHIAELNATNNALVRSYSWGLDLSGSLDGAGGVGGLLWLNSVASGAHFHAMEGNGNVAALVKATDGSVSANYEYDPFGQKLRSTGLMATENPFQFSTKRTDRTTDLVLYEYRPYIPSLGRWPNRDPIEETGGPNVYAFVHNTPIASIDGNGRESWIPITDPKQGNPVVVPDPFATKFQWAPAPCGNGLDTGFIQVGLGGSMRKNNPFVDDGKHGQSSDKPTCPPLYPGANGNLFEDTPSTRGGFSNPLLWGLTFEVCRVCVKKCCDGYIRIVSIGACRTYTLPGSSEVVDLENAIGFNSPSSRFNSTVNNSYPRALSGGCFKCKSL